MQGTLTQLCTSHHQPIIMFDGRIENSEQRGLCLTCIQQRYLGNDVEFVEDLKKQQQKVIDNSSQISDDYIVIMKQCIEQVLSFKQMISQNLDKIVQIVLDYISIVTNQQEYLNNLLKGQCNYNLKEIEQKCKEQLSIQDRFKSKITERLCEFKMKLFTDPLLIKLDSENIKLEIQNQTGVNQNLKLQTNQLNKQIDEQEIEKASSQQVNQNEILIMKQYPPNQQLNQSLKLLGQEQKEYILIPKYQKQNKKFIYESIQDSYIQENIMCLSFAFNNDSSILFIGRQDSMIKVYEFNNGKIQKEIQTLTDHKKDVTCLIWAKKSNSLISGSQDQLIIIWKQDYNNQWKIYQILQDHTNFIRCIVMNDKEDQLISGSDDKKIKFWSKVGLSWSCQQTIDASFSVQSLSLNASEKSLIASGQANEIRVIEYQHDQQWVIAQIIETVNQGWRLGFTNDNQFVFQPHASEILIIYTYEQEQKQFIQTKQIQVQRFFYCDFYFPCQFIESKNILIVKNGSNVNIFGIDQDGEYILQQSIKFESFHIFGRLTDEGQFLITWSDRTNQIQIRHLLYLE